VIRNCKLGLSTVLVLILVGQSGAATVSYGPTSVGPLSAGSAGIFTLSQFDPALGTLNSVFVEIIGNSFGGANTLDNESTFAGTAALSIGTNITVSGPASLLILSTPVQSTTGAIAADDEAGPPDYTGPDSISLIGTTSSDYDSDLLMLGLAPYIGLGNVTFNYTSSTNSSTSANVAPTFSFNSPTEFSFDAQVTYIYDPIPEPSMFGICGLLGAGLAACSRRKRLKNALAC
jgi:hypothetical protein